MSNKREFRTSGSVAVEGNSLTGYAALFDTSSEDLGGFTEQLAPGCFRSSLSSNTSIVALVNHDTNNIVGRTTAGTLKLSEDDKGLGYVIDLPDTQAARDLKISVARGDLSGCSFGFICTADTWKGNLRTINDLSLFEISVGVTFPAYEATSMSLRALMFPDGVPTPPVGAACTCPCAQCRAGSCGICSNDDCDDALCSDGGCTNQTAPDDGSDDDAMQLMSLRIKLAEFRARVNDAK